MVVLYLTALRCSESDVIPHALTTLTAGNLVGDTRSLTCDDGYCSPAHSDITTSQICTSVVQDTLYTAEWMPNVDCQC